MKGKKIIIFSIIINILLIGVIYNFIKKDYINTEKIIVKAMTGTEYENSITSLNIAHEEYANYIQESKAQIASAITEMGVTTSNNDTVEKMVSNIKNISTNSERYTLDFTGKAWKIPGNNESVRTPSISYSGDDIIITQPENLTQGLSVFEIDLTDIDCFYVNVKGYGSGSHSEFVVYGFCDVANTYQNSKVYYGQNSIPKGIVQFDVRNLSGTHYFFIRTLNMSTVTLSKFAYGVRFGEW